MKLNSNPVARTALYVVILAIVLLYLYPLLYLVNIALKAPEEYLINPAALTRSLDFSNFTNAWQDGGFGRLILNSLLYVSFPTIVSLLITLLAAFPISRRYVRKSHWWYSFFLVSLFLPNGLLPQFYIVLQMHLYNSTFGYMLLKTSGVGLGFLILTGYIKSIPRDLDEAASMDGCGYFRYVLTIVIQLVKPALVTAAIFQAIGIWNDIIGSTVYLADKKLYPIVLGLYQFYGDYSNQWTVLSAGIIIVALPLILLYVSLQRFFVEGAVAGAIKA